MSNAVIQLGPDRIRALMAHYAGSRIERNAPGVVFAAKSGGVSITAYKSGKVLFQGGGADAEASRWGGNASPSSPKAAPKGEKLPSGLARMSILGSDETGTGDFFGPVTVAACFVPAEKIALAEELGVKDSKMLTDAHMLKIGPEIKEAFTNSVLVLPNEKYNTVQAKGWSQGKIKALLHNQALKHVLRKMDGLKPDHILIDQFAERGIYYRHIASEPEIIRENVLFSTKAENLHVSVACASILARVAFLEEMDRLSEKAGTRLPKGAGKPVDEAAAKILIKKGDDFLASITKRHFANTKKAAMLAAKRSGRS
ncbi:ribonuclease HIII [Bhargavaea beijingensis]|uniref:ribonuclease HIII n=1 Tax=Bhargavaea beijingensis TaxID=426756 RepID=UPI00222497A8|nr:ribonuclease HIII [Bhargavaea beijingensis]MCW1929224.1 ribonuclease HIII [Bhargavaea beijingensis]